MTTLKASGNTQIQRLAGAIAGNIRIEGAVNVSLVGASALNQAIKACIVARRFLRDDNSPVDIVIQPEFSLQNFEENESRHEVTTILLHVRKVDFDPENAVEAEAPAHQEDEKAE